jgi:L-amino acid N-acyltransferase YncA
LVDDAFGQLWLITAGPGADADGYGVITWGYSLESGGRDALVDELYVRRRGAGVGSAALQQMMEAAAASGGQPCLSGNRGAPHAGALLYSRLGFRTEDSCG